MKLKIKPGEELLIYDHEEAIGLALRTWYPEEHPLHLNPHHPLGKLLGEWGELLDDYMKSIYKPGYEFEPENELGDIWYYVRILAHQTGVQPVEAYALQEDEMDVLLALTIRNISRAFYMFVTKDHLGDIGAMIDWSYSVLLEIARRNDLTLDDLTASNWEKLKPGSERGDEWAKARDT